MHTHTPAAPADLLLLQLTVIPEITRLNFRYFLFCGTKLSRGVLASVLLCAPAFLQEARQPPFVGSV